jgi:hypothetical protein
MLYAFGFERIGVVASDLYFVDPDPGPGQEGPEQGVRVEVRLLEQGELNGSIYSARPIGIDRAIWRADLLESVDNPGSLDRAHHHPRCRGWEPGTRRFVKEMTANPVAFVGKYLSDVDGLLEAAGLTRAEIGESDADSLQAAVPEILDVVRRLLDRVRAGELARPPSDEAVDSARVSWL